MKKLTILGLGLVTTRVSMVHKKNWLSFKDEFEATVLIHGLGDILSIVDDEDEDNEAHLKKRKDDKKYDGKIRKLYAILKKVTAKGTAKALIKPFAKNADGALAWKALYMFYEQEGNKDLYGYDCLVELTNLTLDFNSFGGMDTYIHKFTLLCTKLEESDQPLTDKQKQTFFLKGIKDRDYAAIKDQVESKSFQETVLTLRRKATLLGKASNTKKKVQSSRKMNNLKGGNKQQTRRQNGNGGGNKSQDALGPQDKQFWHLSLQAWKAMTPEQKKFWDNIRLQKQQGGDKPMT